MAANSEHAGPSGGHAPARWAARSAPVVALAALLAGAVATGTIGGGRTDRIQGASSGDDPCLLEAPPVLGDPALTAGDLEAWWWAEHGTMELDVDDPDGEPLGVGRVAAWYVGNQDGVRGDIAFAHAVSSSGWFTEEFSSAEHYNFGAIPAEDPPEDATPDDPEYYAAYETPGAGVQAHLDRLHTNATGDAGADTWDKVGDHWDDGVEGDGHDLWFGDGGTGDLYQEMTDFADELAERRQAELDGESDADADDEHRSAEDEGDADADDEGDADGDPDADGTGDDGDDADGSEDTGDVDGTGDDGDDCDDRNDPCQATAAENLGYTEPTLADDFVDFDTERWTLTGAEPPADDGDDNEGDRTPPIEVDNETLTLTTRVDDPSRITMTSALGQQHGLWEVRARLPLDAAGYHSSIGLTIRPDDDALQLTDEEAGEAEEAGDPEGDGQESEEEPPPPLIFMDNAADEPTGRLVTAMVPVHREFTTMDEDDNNDPGSEEAAGVDWRYRIETSETELDDNRWHNWAVEWRPDAVRLYRDGELWYETPEGTELPEGEAHLIIEAESLPLLRPFDDEASETAENAELIPPPDGPGDETAEEYHFGIDRVRVFELMDRDDECDPPDDDDDEDPPPTTEQTTTTTVEEPPETTTTTVEEPPETTTTTVGEPSSEPPSTGQEGSPRTPSAASTQTVGTPRLTG